MELEERIEICMSEREGGEIRKIVRELTEKYEQDESKLIKIYERHPNLFVQGVASSALYALTGSIEFITRIPYGGLGAEFYKTPRRVILTDFQGMHAYVSGKALSQSEIKGQALWFALTGGNSLKSSRISENGLWHSNNVGNSLANSKNSDLALVGSVNREDALYKSTNLNNALTLSINSGNALELSSNYNKSLQRSRNSGQALRGSLNRGESLQLSYNTGFALKESRNHEKALLCAQLEKTCLIGADVHELFSEDKLKDIEDREEMTCKQVGDILGLTGAMINIIEIRAIRKLRERFRKMVINKKFGPIFENEEDLIDTLMRMIPDCLEVYNSGIKLPLPFFSNRPAYSSGILNRQGNLTRYFESGFTTRVLAASREGLYDFD